MIKAQGLETCLIVLLSSQSLSLFSPLLLSFACPSSCHFLGTFPSKCTLSYNSDLLSSLSNTGAYSLQWVKTDPPDEADSPSLVIEMQKDEENRWKKFRRSFFKTISWLARHFSTALSYLHIRSRISPSFFHSHCNKWFPFVINSNLPSADGYFRSISAKLMSSRI